MHNDGGGTAGVIITALRLLFTSGLLFFFCNTRELWASSHHTALLCGCCTEGELHFNHIHSKTEKAAYAAVLSVGVKSAELSYCLILICK